MDRSGLVGRPEVASPPRDAPGGARGQRVAALDAARALAIVGMLAVNIGPVTDSGLAGLVIRLPHGRASLLFVLLAGIGLSILTRRVRAGQPVPWRTVFWRAALLALLGLSTQLLDHDVNVILTTYAALFLIGSVFVKAPSWVVAGTAGLMAVIGPVVYLLVLAHTTVTFDGEAGTLQDPPSNILTATFLTGPYPVITWLAPFLFGMWLGRLDLLSRALAVRFVLLGATAAILSQVVSRGLIALLGEGDGPGPLSLLSVAGHTQMPLWLVGGTGSALAVLGAVILLLPTAGRAANPLIAAGQLALTLYVAHLVLVAVFVRPGPDTAAQGLLITALLSAVLIAFATLWRRFFARGPLELLLRPPFAR